jgi:hypothetical protein
LLLFLTTSVGCKVFGWTHVWWCGLVYEGVLMDNDQGVGQEDKRRTIALFEWLQQVANV